MEVFCGWNGWCRQNGTRLSKFKIWVHFNKYMCHAIQHWSACESEQARPFLVNWSLSPTFYYTDEKLERHTTFDHAWCHVCSSRDSALDQKQSHVLVWSSRKPICVSVYHTTHPLAFRLVLTSLLGRTRETSFNLQWEIPFERWVYLPNVHAIHHQRHKVFDLMQVLHLLRSYVTATRWTLSLHPMLTLESPPIRVQYQIKGWIFKQDT